MLIIEIWKYKHMKKIKIPFLKKTVINIFGLFLYGVFFMFIINLRSYCV